MKPRFYTTSCNVLLLISGLVAAAGVCSCACAADVFVRAKVLGPADAACKLKFSGFRHAGEPWYFPEVAADAPAGQWSAWVDLGNWPWHGKIDRAGGIAEWPSMTIRAELSKAGEKKIGRSIEVEIADAADESKVIHHFTEKTESDKIGFLVPTPLRENAKEFETGTQMGARHFAWAKEATGESPIVLKQFDICTSLWGPYDPALARQDLQTLRHLGFNLIGGTDVDLIAQAGARTARSTWIYNPDPEKTDRDWNASEGKRIADALKSAEGRKELDNVAHWIIADEIRALDLQAVNPDKRDGWFRDYLRTHGITDADLGVPIDHAHFPGDLVHRKTLPRDASLAERRLLYYAAKFGQWWSVRQLRHTSDLMHAGLPRIKTETLPTDHGFFNAWGPPTMGMSAPLLDLFEIGRQHAVDQLSAEDWLGLNHMYGPPYTWTGAQSFEYLNAIIRSAIADQPILQRGLITPSDDGYLRLKAYSALGQGGKSFFFWTYGPTFIGTENYWSDLKSEYVGIAKLNRALAQAEPILYPAKPVRDPVAILYSVSHDIWHSDDPTAFVEKRLLWHGLRHLHVQPDFIREEDAAAPETLAKYKVLYVVDWCVSRAASAAIDLWVRNGGVVYLSAGAATLDEFCEPYVPPFARTVWPDDASAQLKSERHSYNERTDLPKIQPMTRVKIRVDDRAFALPVIGARLSLRKDLNAPLGKFDDDHSAAVAVAAHGKGQVVGVGFMPMLAYGQLANFKPTTLEEHWPAEPRTLANLPMKLAHIIPVIDASEPVVEASLLSGPSGSAVVLANYTYKPIKSLTINLNLSGPITRAISTEGANVQIRRINPDTVRLELPLEWTDIILLPTQQ